MEIISETIARYRDIYGNEPEIVAIAPGRVNLIGEHTDYNQGYVLPVAIDRAIIVAAGNRKDEMFHLNSIDLQASIVNSLSRLTFDSAALWSNYPKGVAYILRQEGYNLHGANFCIRGNIPIGAGLSSSAALEVASTVAFKYLNDIDISAFDVVKISQSAETEFVGVQCGIMDQFISVLGKSNHALFLDCQSLKYSHIPCPENVRLVVCDTGVRRELTRSAYNQRQSECRQAVLELSANYPGIQSLRDVTWEQFEAEKNKLSPVSSKRALHVISENKRVLKSVAALKEQNLQELGKLMVESHESLRDNFDVSCRELNVFVEIAASIEGVYGARMTGAGFGGSGICLVAEDAIDLIIDRLRTEYPRRAGQSLTMYLASIGDGAAVIQPHKSMTPVYISQ